MSENQQPRKRLKILDQIEKLPVVNWPVQQWQADQTSETTDRIVIEEPFEVRINGRSLAAIMRTPGHDRELALGFLLSEGIISQPSEVVAIVRAKDRDGLPEENVLDVQLEKVPAGLFGAANSADAETNPETAGRFERRFTVASSCGLCGKNSIVEVCRRLPPLPADDFTVTPQTLVGLPAKLREAQAVFERTGGLHAAGLFDQSGNLLLMREDVGRHNAVDKVIGRMALDGNYPLPQHLLLVSGRTSFEIVQKALAAQIPLIAAVSAPSSLALNLADEAGITLVGFLRGQNFNVYTGAQRIKTVLQAGLNQ